MDGPITKAAKEAQVGYVYPVGDRMPEIRPSTSSAQNLTTYSPTTHPLYQVFIDAIQQATKGKGTRHGGDATPFLEQPWVHYAKMHGDGFLTGQAAKKLEEAASRRAKGDLSGEGYEQELLGALVYLGMAVLSSRKKVGP